MSTQRDAHHVFLIPGFFGFATIGQFSYFNGVTELVASGLERHGINAAVTCADTQPTASLPSRVARLAEFILARVPDDASPIHLVGHSTGGLDARLLVTPGVRLPSPIAIERLARRVRTVVTVSTPNHGTPAASFFVGLMGQKMLRIVAVLAMYIARHGKLQLSALRLALRLLTTLDDTVGLKHTVLDRALDTLLVGMDDAARAGVDEFFNNIRQDRALLTQLTPEGLAILNTVVADRETARYGSVVTRARRPGLRSRVRVGLDPYAQLVYLLFKVAWKITRKGRDVAFPIPPPETLAALRRALGREPEPIDSDGLVPTLSQLHGELIHAVRADHGDIIGHYGDHTLDLLVSGSGYRARHHKRAWRAVADYIADA